MNPRRKLLSVIIKDVPPPRPRPGEEVEVWLGQEDEGPVVGRVMAHLDGYGTLRVELNELQEIRP